MLTAPADGAGSRFFDSFRTAWNRALGFIALDLNCELHEVPEALVRTNPTPVAKIHREAKRSTLIGIAGPGAAGKDTILKQAGRANSRFRSCVFCTTRPPRPGESDGVDYEFITNQVFLEAHGRGEFVFVRNIPDRGWYGLRRSTFEADLRKGLCVIKESPSGLQSLLGSAVQMGWNGQARNFFVLPPSPVADTLWERAVARSKGNHNRLQLLSTLRIAQADEMLDAYNLRSAGIPWTFLINDVASSAAEALLKDVELDRG